MNTPEPGITALARGGTPAAAAAGRRALSVWAPLPALAAGGAASTCMVALAA